MQRNHGRGALAGRWCAWSAIGLAVLLAWPLGTALAAGPIGMNYVNYGTTSSSPQNANAVAVPLDNTMPCGAPGWRQSVWNNYGYRSANAGVGPQMIDNSGALIPSVFASWFANSITSNGVNRVAPDKYSKHVMSYYLDSNGAANLSDTGAFTYNNAANAPNVYVEGLSDWMAANGASSYAVVLYTEGGNAIGRVGAFWVQRVTAFHATNHYATELGDHLTPTMYVVDNWQYNNSVTFEYPFIQVPDTATSQATAAPGNFLVFRGLTDDKIEIRTEEISSTDANKRVWIAGWQIWPEKTPAASRPVVTVTKIADAAEGATGDQFTVTRTGDTTNPLTVQFKISGSAIRESDYTFNGQVIIPAGQASANGAIVPIDDAQLEDTETVILTVANGGDCQPGDPSSITINLTDNDTPAGTTFCFVDNFDQASEEEWALNFQGRTGTSNWYNGWVPAGWRVYCSTTTTGESVPDVMYEDYWSWAYDGRTGETSNYPNWTSALGHAGKHNYAVAWSGRVGDGGVSGHSFRLKLNNPGQDYGGRSSGAWFAGDTPAPSNSRFYPGNYPRHWTGTYPMDLRQNSIKAKFDLCIRTGTKRCGLYADNVEPISADVLSFAVQPVQDIDHIKSLGGWLGIGGLPGFQIEFDVYPNATDPNFLTGGATAAQPLDPRNHVGLDVAVKNPAGGEFASVATNLDTGYNASLPINMKQVGDNNQPLTVTVFYNDPAESPDGTMGWVRVYMYVDPATAPAVPYIDTTVAPLYTPIAFGMESVGSPAVLVPKNNGLGELILEKCVGAWPTAGDKSVFGFLASTGSCNGIMQVDNVNVQTNPAAATACGQTWWDVSTFNPGENVALDPAGKVANDTTGLSVPGWTCFSYPIIADYWNPSGGLMQWFKGSVLTCDAIGMGGPGVVEPDINWRDPQSGNEDNIPVSREMPGMTGYDDNWYGIVAKGYVYFPQAGEYSLCVNSDDGIELSLGNQLILKGSTRDRGINAGTFKNIQVTTPGVYPIQLLYFEGSGAASCEFYRRMPIPLAAFVSVGAETSGLTDQPLVFSKFNGNLPATNLTIPSSDAPQVYQVASATLDTAARMGGTETASGSAVLSMTKLVYAPTRWYYDSGNGGMGPDMTYSVDAWQCTNEMNWLNFLQNRLTTTPTVSVLAHGNTPWNIECQGFSEFPSYVSTAKAIGARFEGYLVFPAPGDYYIGMAGEDGIYLWVGQQLVYQTLYFDEPGKIMKLTVPQAGVYPVRVDYASGIDRRALVFYQVVPGHSKVRVNDAMSTIKFAQSCTAGNYQWPARFQPITTIPPANDPNSHKVAEVGQGGTPGWNATLTKFTDSAVDIWYTAQAALWYKGADPKAIAYPTATDPQAHSLASLNPTMVQQTAVVPAINFWTQGDDSQIAGCTAPYDFSWRNCQNLAAGFLPRFYPVPYLSTYFSAISSDEAVNEDRFAMTFEGYIEFANAGDYVIYGGTSDGLAIWVGGQMVSGKSFSNGWPHDSNPGLFHVDAPGIYNIRVDYFQQIYNVLVDVFMVLPDGTAALINSPAAAAAGVNVYATLADGIQPLTTFYKDPTVLPASTKVAPYAGGGIPGYHVMIATETIPAAPVVTRGYGYEMITDLFRADKLLGIVVDGDAPTPSMNGTLTDYVTGPKDRLFIYPDGGVHWPNNQDNHVAARVNGYMALKAGGHMLSINTDDGARLVMGGRLVDPETAPVAGSTQTVSVFKRMVGGKQIGAYKLGNVGSRHQDQYYVYAEEDGIYAFEVTYNQAWGGTVLDIRETPNPVENNTANLETAYEYPNYGTTSTTYSNTFTKVYISLCPSPWADADGDHDVDLQDFGILQGCLFTGGSYSGGLSGGCACLDRAGASGFAADGSVDAFDAFEFVKCFTGPTVPFNSDAPPAGCQY